MNDHIPKPVNPETLYSALLRWMPPRDRRDALVVQVPPGSDLDENGEVSTLRQLQAIAGLDAESGLRNLQNKLPFYLRQLQHFVERHAAEAKNIELALDSNDRDAAQRAAHSLKGSAATLGVTHVRQTAADIEALLKQQPDDALPRVAALIPTLAQQLDAFVVSVKGLQTPSAQAIDVRPPHCSAEQLHTVVQGMSMLLAESNIESQAFFEQHHQALEQALGREAVDALAGYVAKFAFDQALAILRRIE